MIFVTHLISMRAGDLTLIYFPSLPFFLKKMVERESLCGTKRKIYFCAPKMCHLQWRMSTISLFWRIQTLARLPAYNIKGKIRMHCNFL